MTASMSKVCALMCGLFMAETSRQCAANAAAMEYDSHEEGTSKIDSTPELDDSFNSGQRHRPPFNPEEGDEDDCDAIIPGETGDYRRELTAMWAQILTVALQNGQSGCSQLDLFTDKVASEMNWRTGFNVVGGAAGVLGAGSAAAGVAAHAHSATSHAAQIANAVADAADLGQAGVESGSALKEGFWDAENEFRTIRDEHRSQVSGAGAWSALKTTHMGVSVLVIGAGVAFGTGGAGLPAYIAGAGAFMATTGAGMAVANETVAPGNNREEWQEFQDFMCWFEYECAKLESRETRSMAKVKRTDFMLRQAGDGRSMMIVPVPQQVLPMWAQPHDIDVTLQVPARWRPGDAIQFSPPPQYGGGQFRIEPADLLKGMRSHQPGHVPRVLRPGDKITARVRIAPRMNELRAAAMPPRPRARTLTASRSQLAPPNFQHAAQRVMHQQRVIHAIQPGHQHRPRGSAPP